jgi:hypothetical protein
MDTRPASQKKPDQRKHLRRPFNYPGTILVGSGVPARACVIVDISETGAKLGVHAGVDIPDEFVLLIGGASGARRECHLVWKAGNRLGVQFVHAPKGQRPPDR